MPRPGRMAAVGFALSPRASWWDSAARIRPVRLRSHRLWRSPLPHGSNFRAERKNSTISATKSIPELLQNRNGRIFETAFQPTDVGTVDPGIHRKSFLRQPTAPLAVVFRGHGKRLGLGCGQHDVWAAW
jgi:hypothetical protein